jgi:hypothetical protein
MADTISDKERRLIDQAIAGGNVAYVPCGVSGVVKPEFTYCKRTGRLLYSNKQQAKARLRAGNRWGVDTYRSLKG